MTGLTTAIRTLTVLRVPGREAVPLSSSVVWFPLVGGLLGALLHCVTLSAAAMGLEWPEGVALLLLGLGVLLTGALHVDGLADAADGLLGGGDRDRRLEIMKDPRLGAYGAVALLLVSLAKWTALVRLLEGGARLSLWIVTAYVASRGVQADLVASLPYARASGGTAAPYVASGTARRLASMASSIALCGLATGPAGVAAWVVAWSCGQAFGQWCRRRVGGVTGDLLGAANELTEALVLVGGALLGGRFVELAP